MTLEAALILPLFMLFIIFLAMMIKIAIAEIALKQSVSRTTEYIATHLYPVQIVKDTLNSNLKKEEQELAKKMAVYALEVFGQGDLVNNFSTTLLNSIIQDIFDETARGHFDKNNVEIVDIQLPSLLGGSGDYLGITVVYKMDLKMPFVHREIILKQKAVERIWIGSS